MKQLALMALLAMQSCVALATQPRFADEILEAEPSPAWYCFLAVAGSEQDQQKTDEVKKESNEEPDCE